MSLDPYGAMTPEVFPALLLKKGFDVRPTIAIHQGSHFSSPEFGRCHFGQGRVKVDGQYMKGWRAISVGD